MGRFYVRISRSIIFTGSLSTARAYFLSEAYDRAETVLDELIPTIDASNDHVSMKNILTTLTFTSS